jgi:DNA-binding LacI/PurR family transcriptional regulator
MTTKRRVVMADVAKASAVSMQTVSRVLNGSAGVQAAKKARVLKAVQELGYHPNLAARTLASSRSGVIGVLIAGHAHFGMVDTLMAVEAAAREAGYYVVIATEERARPELVRDAYVYLQRRQVECVVVLAESGRIVPVIQGVHERTPTVLVLAGQRVLDGISTVSIDQVAGGRMAAEHLTECGYRDILHLTGDLKWQDAIDRLKGFRAFCREVGIDPRVVEGRSWDPAEGYRAGLEILAGGKPRAVFAGNDHLALGLLHAISEAGLRVPEDIAVIGFDDVLGAAWYAPPLSSVRQDFRAIGENAIDLVADLIDGKEPRNVHIAAEVVPRFSTLGMVAKE